MKNGTSFLFFFIYIYILIENSIKPLNPTRNTSLLSTGSSSRKNNACSSSSSIIALSAIHDLAREILHIKRTEADILQRSTTTRMKEMTFLEKSASKSKATTSASISSSAQSSSSGVVGLPLFAFLTAVRRSLEAWLTEVTIETDTVTPLPPHSLLPLLPVLTNRRTPSHA